MPKNTPWVSLATSAFMICVGLTMVLTDHAGKNGGVLLFGVLIANMPGVLASIFAERTSRDVRNGTVVEKVRQGTHQALEERDHDDDQENHPRRG